MTKARYIMIGGFLGAGKTTAILKIAEQLRDEGLRVGLITNDQSFDLVDTKMLDSHGFPVEEITGGCFCCKFNSLVEAAEKLSAESRPDVFIAEPVGSCTDLKATVSYPLRRIYGENYTIAPLTVLVDPNRALRILGVEQGKAFSEKVIYIYLKQLEEAEIIVINKCDLLTGDRQQALQSALAERFPKALVLCASAREGSGLDDWLDRVGRADLAEGTVMDVDYDLYGEGEALLGWLNCSVQVAADEPLDGNRLMIDLAKRLQEHFSTQGAEIAHLKMTLTPTENGNDIGVANLVGNQFSPELSHILQEPLDGGGLILNLRAEAESDTLEAAVRGVLQDVAQSNRLGVTIEHIECFSPAKPNPTHRFTTGSTAHDA